MAAAAPKKKQTLKATEQHGLWLDESRLPTTLAARGSRKVPSFLNFPPLFRAHNRILALADIALGNRKVAPLIDQRKKERRVKKA